MAYSLREDVDPAAEWSRQVCRRKALDSAKRLEVFDLRGRVKETQGVEPADFREAINLDRRPSTYWPESGSSAEVLSRIKGTERRAVVAGLLEAGEIDWANFWAVEELPEAELRAWTRQHPPHFMGGEYLPSLAEGEVEIARVSLASTTGDVFSVRAQRRVKAGIQYRVVDEYGGEYEVDPSESKEPLSLRELVKLIDNAKHVENKDVGLVQRFWEQQLAHGYSADESVSFAEASSEIYPGLEIYYAVWAELWVTEVEERAKSGESEEDTDDDDDWPNGDLPAPDSEEVWVGPPLHHLRYAARPVASHLKIDHGLSGPWGLAQIRDEHYRVHGLQPPDDWEFWTPVPHPHGP